MLLVPIMIVVDIIMHQMSPTTMPLPLFKPMAQSRHGVVQVMEAVVLSILKPAGNVGATVQLAIAPPELLKVMSVMVKSIKAIWFVPIMIVVDIIMHQMSPTTMPLPLFKPMAQSRHGVVQVMEAQRPPHHHLWHFLQ
jgi:hypothetical protein